MTAATPASDWDDLLASLGLTPSNADQPAPSNCPCAGTRTAYQQHRRRGETPCAKSKAANAAYLRTRLGCAPRSAPQCGTYSGYQAHARRGEKPCERCVEARRERDRAAYAARKQASA